MPVRIIVAVVAAAVIGVAVWWWQSGKTLTPPPAIAPVAETLPATVEDTGVPATPEVQNVVLPPLDSFAVLSAEIYEYHAPLVADPAKRALYKPVTLERILRDGMITAPQYIASRRQMVLARRRIASTLSETPSSFCTWCPTSCAMT